MLRPPSQRVRTWHRCIFLSHTGLALVLPGQQTPWVQRQLRLTKDSDAAVCQTLLSLHGVLALSSRLCSALIQPRTRRDAGAAPWAPGRLVTVQDPHKQDQEGHQQPCPQCSVLVSQWRHDHEPNHIAASSSPDLEQQLQELHTPGCLEATSSSLFLKVLKVISAPKCASGVSRYLLPNLEPFLAIFYPVSLNTGMHNNPGTAHETCPQTGRRTIASQVLPSRAQ